MLGFQSGVFGLGPIHVCLISVHFEYRLTFESCQCQIRSSRIGLGPFRLRLIIGFSLGTGRVYSGSGQNRVALFRCRVSMVGLFEVGSVLPDLALSFSLQARLEFS